MKGAKILLVEDDPLIRRFVGMALAPLEFDVRACGSVGEALHQLSACSVDLVLTDLTLPDQSGFALLERLAQDVRLRGAAKIVVLSASASITQSQFERIPVWRVLSKPVSLSALESCVLEALGSDTASSSPADATLASDESGAVEKSFGGNRELFEAFKAACLQQFPSDVQSGDLACRSGDMQALRHLAHSLATVLHLLGNGALGCLARNIEQQLVAGDVLQARATWQVLRDRLPGLLAPSNSSTESTSIGGRLAGDNT